MCPLKLASARGTSTVAGPGKTVQTARFQGASLTSGSSVKYELRSKNKPYCASVALATRQITIGPPPDSGSTDNKCLGLAYLHFSSRKLPCKSRVRAIEFDRCRDKARCQPLRQRRHRSAYEHGASSCRAITSIGLQAAHANVFSTIGE